MSTLSSPILAVYTDRRRLPSGMPLGQAVAPAVTAGANLVVFGEADLPPAPRLAVGRFVVSAVQRRAPLLVTGGWDFVEKVGADGLLGPAGTEPTEGKLLALAVSDSAEAAAAGPADLLLMACDWNDPVAALALVREAAAAGKPVVIGFDPPLERVPHLLEAGAAGIALSETVMAAYDRSAAVRPYARALGLQGGSR